ncbi:MAG: hypothetical protein ABL917_02270 [Parcubacteria group bacterium]
MNPEEKNINPVPPTTENLEQPVEPERKIFKTLRTYQGDVDEVLSQGKASAATIFVAEEKRREEKPQIAPKQVDNRLRNKIFTTFSISLFFLGIIVVGLVYYIKSTEEVAIIQKTKALISFSREKDFTIASSTRAELIQNIISEKESFNLPPNSVLYINTTDPSGNKENIETALKLLAPKMPSSLSRSFDKEYMLGIYSFDTNEPFIILTTKDYANSFSGMLNWEKYIESDLGQLFNIPQNASSTPGLFVDQALKNKDLRILKDQRNKTILLYSFIDRETLVITTNENIFEAVIGKYLISKQNR